MKPHTLTRRHFLRNASLASAVSVAFPAVLRSQGATGASPNNRLNVACFGVGNQGRVAVEAMVGENLVAFCDVDDQCAAQTYGKHSGVPRFRDFRKVFDAFGNQIDAVTISTPDHMHYPIAMAALSLGKHVFVEKPMTHTIWESRRLRELAAEKGVATQMGNQGHALEGIRLLKEWFDAGVLGEVREVQSWTDRPIWPQGVRAPDHSKMIPVVPSSLDWDLWLGVAAQRAYDPAYVPFNWRGYWDFGTGAAGDMGCHLMDGAFYALQLDAPEWVEAISAKANTYSAPSASVVTYRGDGSLAPRHLSLYDHRFHLRRMTRFLPWPWSHLISPRSFAAASAGRRQVCRWVHLVTALLLLAGATRLEAVTLAPIFGDGMVVQAHQPLPIWGDAAAGERVTVTFAGQVRETVAGPDGRWRVTLAPLDYAAGHASQTLVVRGAGEQRVTDVLIGEVWLTVAPPDFQSWAQGRVGLNDGQNPLWEGAGLKVAPDPALRVRSRQPHGPRWLSSSAENTASISAVAHFFAEHLRSHRNVPVGLIDLSESDASVLAYLPESDLATMPPLAMSWP
jgi:predicted dehydrogenase